MVFKLGERVRDTSTTTGTTDFTLGGAAASGFQTFDDVLDNGDTTWYLAAAAAEWEMGVGTFNSGVLERTTVLASSAGGTTKVAFSAGTKFVICTPPAVMLAKLATLAAVATSGAYSDLTGKPTLGTSAQLDIDTDASLAADSDARLATQKAVKSYVDATADRMDLYQYKGSINCSANPNYPAASAGHVYRVSAAGKIGGASGPNVEIGDSLICNVDSTSSGNHATVGVNWTIEQVNLDGAMVTGSYPALVSLEGLSLAAGDLVYATAADTLARLAIGSTGHVLMVSGGVPAWAAIAAGPQVISSASASGSAFTVTSGISGLTRIIAHFKGVSFAGNTALCVQFTSDGGSNWYPSTASNAPMSSTLTAASAYDITATIEIRPDGLSGSYVVILGGGTAAIITAPNAAGSAAVPNVNGNFRLSSALNGVRFVPSAATTFDAGTITVTGA